MKNEPSGFDNIIDKLIDNIDFSDCDLVGISTGSNMSVFEYHMSLLIGQRIKTRYKKLTACLQEDYNLVINHKKVYRLCKELDILRPQRKIYPNRPRKLAKREKVTGSNQLWQMDIKYGYITDTRQFFFQLSVIHYGFIQGDKCPAHQKRAIFLISEDNGKTWNFRSEIPYAPDKEKDPYWDKRDGFSEPNVAFLTDGSIFCLLRTTDGNGVGPMYWSRSTDEGRTWSDPEVFDNLGVWPAIITLNNGVTLTTYGRPGIYLRATADLSGIEWEDRYEIMAPDASGLTNTCAYTDLIALDDNTAYLIYSDFYYPDDEGKKRKTILGRKITVHI